MIEYFDIICWSDIVPKPKPSNPKSQLYVLDNNRLLFEGIVETQ